MEHYVRKLRHLKHRAHGRGYDDGGSHTIRKFKKIIIIAVIAVIVFGIALLILAIMAASWLFNRGSDEIKQAGQGIVDQVQPSVELPTVPSLNLESYVVDGQVVNTDELQQTFNALPAQLQDAWLNQFQTQIDALQEQSGITDETIQTFTNLHKTFQTLQGE
jgi:hypothetical protein